ncbi:MAG: hypothetical protein ACX93P_17575 [Roseovarius sp.]
MTNQFLGAAVVAVIALSGCMATPPTAEMDPLKAQLSGQTGVHESGTTVTLHEDGRISGQDHNGQAIAGVWDVRDGRYCRTITAPESLAGTNCQDVEFDGNRATFITDDGTESTFVIQG